MPLLQTCSQPGCTILTIGGLCIEHEPVRESRAFPRGRPFPPVSNALLGRRDAAPALATHKVAAGVSSLSM